MTQKLLELSDSTAEAWGNPNHEGWRHTTARIDTGDSEYVFIGPSDAHYSDLAAMFHSDILELCGCGCPGDVSSFLVKCTKVVQGYTAEIRAANFNFDGIESLDKRIARLIEDDPEIVAEFVLHFLDSKGLTEHGGSVYGSSVSERGEQYIDAKPLVE